MNEQANHEAEGAAYTLGRHLEKTRELRGMTQAQVAAELRLALRFVVAMEVGAYQELPEPAFVRGYLRRYAQLLKLSPDEVVAQFNNGYAASTAAATPQERSQNPLQLLGSIARPKVRLGRLVSWASFVLLALLILGALFWNYSARPAAPAISEAALGAEPVTSPVTATIPAASSVDNTPLAAEVNASAVTTPAGTEQVTLLPTPSGPAIFTMPAPAAVVASPPLSASSPAAQLSAAKPAAAKPSASAAPVLPAKPVPAQPAPAKAAPTSAPAKPVAPIGASLLDARR